VRFCGSKEGYVTTRESIKEARPMIWLLVLLLVIFAVLGGVAVSKFIFLLLVVALVVALFGGRSTT
jgi:energy-coupling factor transporter transmembrane protein EcfT